MEYWGYESICISKHLKQVLTWAANKYFQLYDKSHQIIKLKSNIVYVHCYVFLSYRVMHNCMIQLFHLLFSAHITVVPWDIAVAILVKACVYCTCGIITVLHMQLPVSRHQNISTCCNNAYLHGATAYIHNIAYIHSYILYSMHVQSFLYPYTTIWFAYM